MVARAYTWGQSCELTKDPVMHTDEATTQHCSRHVIGHAHLGLHALKHLQGILPPAKLAIHINQGIVGDLQVILTSFRLPTSINKASVDPAE